MDDLTKGNGVSRRNCLKNLGAAGLGSMALFSSTASADVGSIKSPVFDYRFRTFGPDEEINIGMIGTVGHTGTILNGIPLIKGAKLVAYSNIENPNLKLPKGTKIY